jgi:hypothetical protein
VHRAAPEKIEEIPTHVVLVKNVALTLFRTNATRLNDVFILRTTPRWARRVSTLDNGLKR